MKKIIKSLIPEKIIILRSLIEGYSYDLIRFFKYSNSYDKLKTESQYSALITYTYHVVEKGLTMPETRLGFGQGKVNSLIDLCNTYLDADFNPSAIPIKHSAQVLNEYIAFHKLQNYQLPAKLVNRINTLGSRLNVKKASEQLEISKDEFLRNKDAAFENFCLSRHTVRNYTHQNIPEKIFEECTKIAQKTPSACNRQPNHIYIIKNKDLQEKILSLQSGNRGFGHLANALIVFTGDISAFRFQDERNEVYFNSGMFAMTFIYALHSKGIGSCSLNWSVKPSKDKKLRRLINIPENETITFILACGYLPDQIKVASSPRKLTKEIFHYID